MPPSLAEAGDPSRPELVLLHGFPTSSFMFRTLASLYALGISGIILPPAVVTVVLLLRQLGPAGTAIGMICVYLGIYLSTVIFFVTGGRIDTLPLNLFQVASAGLYLDNWHLIFAYVLVMSVPLVVVLAVAQRRVISGITGGAVK